MWPQTMGQFNTPAIWARLHRYFDAVPAVTTFTFVSDDLAGFFFQFCSWRKTSGRCQSVSCRVDKWTLNSFFWSWFCHHTGRHLAPKTIRFSQLFGDRSEISLQPQEDLCQGHLYSRSIWPFVSYFSPLLDAFGSKSVELALAARFLLLFQILLWLYSESLNQPHYAFWYQICGQQVRHCFGGNQTSSWFAHIVWFGLSGPPVELEVVDNDVLLAFSEFLCKCGWKNCSI